jgi:hypothetical protein
MAISKATASSIAPAAKGDLVAGTATNDADVLAVGADDTVLTADSTEATGLKWAAIAGGGANWSLLNAGGTALTGASTITVSGISGVDKILVVIDNAKATSVSGTLGVRLNTDTASNYYSFGGYLSITPSYGGGVLGFKTGADNLIPIAVQSTNASAGTTGFVMLSGCNVAGVKAYTFGGGGQQYASETGHTGYWGGGYYNSSSTISSASVTMNSNFNGGTVYVYTSA